MNRIQIRYLNIPFLLLQIHLCGQHICFRRIGFYIFVNIYPFCLYDFSVTFLDFGAQRLHRYQYVQIGATELRVMGVSDSNQRFKLALDVRFFFNFSFRRMYYIFSWNYCKILMYFSLRNGKI